LSSVDPAVIAFCCTSGSFVRGKGHDQEIVREIEKETGKPAVTTTTAVLEALKAFGCRKIAMTTPYNEEIAQKEEKFLQEAIPGLQILAVKNLGIVSAVAKGDLFPASAYQAAREVDRPEAEVIFISCTAWRTIEVIETLERDLGKTVVTSNQATMWACLKKMGFHEVAGYGRLLSDHL
jgi:maleate isomerase